jgi:hypothetical protein
MNFHMFIGTAQPAVVEIFGTGSGYIRASETVAAVIKSYLAHRCSGKLAGFQGRAITIKGWVY